MGQLKTELTKCGLDLFWRDYNMLATPERFGQFLFNRTGIEIANSYNIEDGREVYKLFETALNALD